MLADRYVLDEELGRSPTGIVWRATDTLLHRTVTVKVVHPRLADDPAFVAALETQTRRVAGLATPGIARLLDMGQQEGLTFLVREHLPGMSLRARVAADGPLAVGETARIGSSVLDAIADMHDHGVLHLGLGSDDVIQAPNGEVRITDLGIGAAVAASRAPEAPELLHGDRLAPERAWGLPADRREDVHAAGALVFELLTGERPNGRTSVRALRGDVPRSMDRTIARALDPDPERRFASARAFAEALTRAAPERIVADDDAQAAPRRRGWVLTWLGVPALIVLVTGAVIGAGVWLGRLEVGGPLGVRPARESPSPIPEVTVSSVTPASVVVADPFGDGEELSSNAPLAADGNPQTAWRSENYFDGELGKPGVGLVLDLTQTKTIEGLRLWTPHPGFTFRVAIGDDPAGLPDDLGAPVVAGALTRVPLEAAGRYVMVWITSVVPVDDGNRAEISEVRVVVSDA
jgi:serine/threonine-protein kinase